MKKLTTAALLLGALGSSALAQTREFDPTPYGFSFRIGIAIPQDGVLRGDSNTWTSIGIDYNIERSILNTGNSFLSVDMVSENFGGGGAGTLWNVMLGNRFFSNASLNGYQSYFLAGLGAIVVDLDGDAEWKFGGVLGAGLELGPALFAEGRVSFGEKSQGVSPGVFGLYLGYRF